MGCGAQKEPPPPEPPKPPPGPAHPRQPKPWRRKPIGPVWEIEGARYEAVNGLYKEVPDGTGDHPTFKKGSDCLLHYCVDNATRKENYEDGGAWCLTHKGVHKYCGQPGPLPPGGLMSAKEQGWGGGAPNPRATWYPEPDGPPTPDPQGPKIVLSGAGHPVNGIYVFRGFIKVDLAPDATCQGKERWEKPEGEGGYCVIFWTDCGFTRFHGFPGGQGAWVIHQDGKVRYQAPGAGDVPPTEGWQVVENCSEAPVPTVVVGAWPDGSVGDGVELERQLPKYWKNSRIVFDERCPVDPDFISHMQKVIDATFKRSRNGKAKLTRDSKGRKAPSDLRIVAVQRVEDSKLWERYRRGQEMIRNRRPQGCTAVNELDDRPDAGFVKTLQALDEKYVKRLDPSINEFYLFHGSSPEGALGISDSGFTISKAGSNAGTMFGKGAYFAEACTKADEYAKEGTGLSAGIYALLLCRVACGEMFRTTKPDLKAIEERRAVLSCDSVLGDREAAVNTYREFVVFDEEVIYPEYVILYQRIFDDMGECAEESEPEDDGFEERPGQ